jgi:hypothetical protein
MSAMAEIETDEQTFVAATVSLARCEIVYSVSGNSSAVTIFMSANATTTTLTLNAQNRTIDQDNDLTTQDRFYYNVTLTASLAAE